MELKGLQEGIVRENSSIDLDDYLNFLDLATPCYRFAPNDFKILRGFLNRENFLIDSSKLDLIGEKIGKDISCLKHYINK